MHQLPTINVIIIHYKRELIKVKAKIKLGGGDCFLDTQSFVGHTQCMLEEYVSCFSMSVVYISVMVQLVFIMLSESFISLLVFYLDILPIIESVVLKFPAFAETICPFGFVSVCLNDLGLCSSVHICYILILLSILCVLEAFYVFFRTTLASNGC